MAKTLTRVIGDVHGKFDQYKKIIKGAERSIQVGDLGVGFKKLNYEGELVWSTNPPHKEMVKHSAKFLRGNHDNPDVCRKHSQWIADGTVENDVMFVGGATSIDRAYRIEGQSWWADEECSLSQLRHFVDLYADIKPRVMITHEVPESIADGILAAVNRTKLDDPSRTRQALQAMLEIHRPEIWIAGHWHVNIDQQYQGMRLIVLNELEYVDLEL
jgi:predicted phosphodiesterase